MSSSTPARTPLELWAVRSLILSVVLAIVAVTPYIAVPIATTKTFVLAVGAIITMGFYIVARLSRGNVVVPPLTLVGALWLPVIAYGLSTAFSGAPVMSAVWGTGFEADTLGFVAVLALLGTLTALIMRRVEQYETLFTVSAVVYGGVALFQAGALVLAQLAPSLASPTYALLGSYENLAFFLGLGVVGTLLAFRVLDLAPRTRQALTVVTVVALFLVAVANASIVWVLLALVALGLFIEAAMMRKHVSEDVDLEGVAVVSEGVSEESETQRPIALALLVLVTAVFFLVGTTLSASLANSLQVNALSVSPSFGATLDVARHTYATNPVFGTGPNTFAVQWLKYRNPALNTNIFWNVDFASGIGFIPTSMVTTGGVGLLAWLLLIGLVLVIGIRTAASRVPEDASARYVLVYGLVGGLYLLALAFFRTPNTALLALAFVSIGLLASSMRFAGKHSQRAIIFSKSPRIGFLVVFSLTLMLFVAIVSAYMLAGRYGSIVALSNAGEAFSAGELDGADAALARSLVFAPTASAYQAQANIGIVRLNQIAASTTLPAAEAQKRFQAALSDGINAAITATQLEPENYQHWLVLGNLYAQAVPLGVSGAFDSANTAFEKAAALNPTSPQIPYVRAQLDIANKNLSGAREKLKAAITLKQDYLDAIYLLSQVEVQAGNVREALASAEAAMYFSPRDPNVLFQVGVLRAATTNYAGAAEALEGAVSANAQFANARYFLAAVYAKQANLKQAIEQLETIAALSEDNAKAVAPMLTALRAGKNPFPANLLTLPSSPVAPAK